MKYYKHNGEVFAYDAEQTAMGYPLTPMTAMTIEEVEAHENQPKTEELAAEAEQAHKAAITAAKLVGVEFQGVMCSATKEDMWGLSAVSPWILSGNTTAFEFDNGNVLVLTPENYQEFYAVWASFRASFFNNVT